MFELPKDRFFGPYELRRPLGVGGAGQVYLAWRRTAIGEPVVCVIKFPLQQHVHDEKSQMLTAEEARLAVMLGSHVNIVQTTDVRKHQGMLLIAMDFVDGCTLHQWLAHRRQIGARLSLATIYTILDHVATGLHYAHSKKTIDNVPLRIVHRDIKPANIMMSRDGFAKISDFGTATPLEREASGKYAYGTCRYMSPEHIRSEVHPAMDIYSLGALAWEMVENRRFRENVEGVEHWPLTLAGNIPEFRHAQTPSALRGLVRNCLDPNLINRPTAQDFLRTLQLCPGFDNNPHTVEAEMIDFLGASRTSGASQGEFAATPELVATFATLNHARRSSPEAPEPPGATDRITASAPLPVLGGVDPYAPGNTVRIADSATGGARPPLGTPVRSQPDAEEDEPTTIRRTRPEAVSAAAGQNVAVSATVPLSVSPNGKRASRWIPLLAIASTIALSAVSAAWFWHAEATRVSSTRSVTVQPQAAPPVAVMGRAEQPEAEHKPSPMQQREDRPSVATATAAEENLSEPGAETLEVRPTPAPRSRKPRPKTKPPATLDRNEKRLERLARFKRRPTVHLQPFHLSSAEVEIGSERYTLDGGRKQVRPKPGKHALRWRTDPQAPWESANKVVFDEQQHYLVRIYSTKQPDVIVLAPPNE